MEKNARSVRLVQLRAARDLSAVTSARKVHSFSPLKVCHAVVYCIEFIKKNTCNNSERVYNLYVSQVSTALARVCGSVQPAPRVRSTTRLGRFSAFPALQVNKTSYFVTKLLSLCRF